MEERQFPRSESEQQTPAELEALRRARARRLKNLAGVVGAVVLALAALGCPQGADLENANSYPAPGYSIGGSTTTAGTATTAGTTTTAGTATGGTATGGTATGGTATGGTSTGSACEVACVKAVFTGTIASCKLCHSKTPAPDGLQSSGLDLESPNVTSRLADIPAKHMDIVPDPQSSKPTVMCPTGDKLIDLTTPANSWLLKKIHGMQDQSATTMCGTQMPQPPTTLKADEITCMETYVNCVATSGGK